MILHSASSVKPSNCMEKIRGNFLPRIFLVCSYFGQYTTTALPISSVLYTVLAAALGIFTQP